MFDSYLQEVRKQLSTGVAKEHAYRPAMNVLLESLEPGLTATNEPKRIEAGAPDFMLARGSSRIGYVEAKDIGVDLRKTEKTEQLKRYKAALPNLILTDYLEFRHFVDGGLRAKARIAEEDGDGKLRVDKDGVQEAERLLRGFLAVDAPSVGTPKELAERMAAQAREIQDLIIRTFASEGEKGQLHQQLSAFRSTLIPGLQPDQFADMYAQTIAYGLFAARTTTDDAENFSRRTAGWDLPRTNPFLRNLFNEIAGPNLDGRVAWIVDDLAELLRRADMAAILEDFGQRTRQEDPVVHFYETFLAAYDPKMREARGVYYTPEPVVSYIVRSVDAVLKQKFGRPMGLADSNTLILDPATGTATFLYYAIRHVYETLQQQGQGGAWSAYVRENLLPRIFGFELLMAPYTVAHMKLGILLGELGYDFGGDERLRVYLTNTLEEGFHPEETIGFAEYIAEEADAAATVKKDEPIEVIIGNPPYSNFGQMNRNPWISSLLEDYKKDLNEKKINLDDDFIKFTRFGQWRIDQTGKGILAFVTNNTYIDGITHRRMRESLMETFTDIYILDLHGSTRRQERTPEGGKDENVFDIQQGVAIAIFVKEPDETRLAKIHHVDLWGLRKDKYEWLSEQDVGKTEWAEIVPELPSVFFQPFRGQEEYQSLWSVKEIFSSVSSGGIQTDRDSLFVDFDIEVLQNRIETFFSPQGLEATFKDRYRVENSSSYALLERRSATQFDPKNIRRVLYRAFDVRWLYYDPKLTSRPGFEVMQHLNHPNLALLVTRQLSTEKFRHVSVCNSLVDRDPLSLNTRERTRVFPLYLYPQNDNLFDAAEEHRRPNLSPEFVVELSERLGLAFVPDGRGDLKETFGPEDVFYYAYAVFHSPEYRERYAEFLKRDFPRLPLTSDKELFAALAEKGAELTGLHLMTSPALENFITRFPEGGTNEVEKVRYADGRQARIHQQRAILRGCVGGGLGVPGRRLSGARQVAQGS